MLRIYRITSIVLIVLLAATALIFRGNIIFATFATTVVTVLLLLIAFQVQRLQLLVRTIAKLDELLELLRKTKPGLSSIESKQLTEELARIRVRLLQDNSLKRSKT
jgi:hypothetical protein